MLSTCFLKYVSLIYGSYQLLICFIQVDSNTIDASSSLLRRKTLQSLSLQLSQSQCTTSHPGPKVSVQVRIFATNMGYIIIYVAQCWRSISRNVASLNILSQTYEHLTDKHKYFLRRMIDIFPILFFRIIRIILFYTEIANKTVFRRNIILNKQVKN